MNYFSAIRTFVRSVELKSFSAAAKELNYEASTVSRHVAELESDLNISLFNRSTRGLSPTEAGSVFYAHCVKLLSQLDEARALTSALNQTPSGLLRLNMPYMFGHLYVLPYIDEFLARYPDISLELLYNDRYIDLIENKIDLSLRIGTLPDSSMHARRLIIEKSYAWASKEWIQDNISLLADNIETSLSLPDALLRCTRLFAKSEESTTSEWLKISSRSRLLSNDYQTLLASCCNGLGIAILPHWFMQASPQAASLKRIFSSWEFSFLPDDMAVWLIYPPKKIVSTKVRCFIDFIVGKINSQINSLTMTVGE